VLTVVTNYGPAFTDRFATGIGLIFLVIVLVSPGGVMGVASWLDARVRRRLVAREIAPGPGATPAASGSPGGA
jgi:branched-chain amino acid transport system permease protein